MPGSRMEGVGKPRHRSQNPSGEGESAGSDRIKAFGVEDLTPALLFRKDRHLPVCGQSKAAMFIRDEPGKILH